LDQQFNFVYASGDDKLCRKVAKAAGERFIPISLNRDGLNVAIVDETADINSAVEKLVYAKFINNGQYPTVPDQIYVHERLFDDFLVKTKIFLYVFYGENIGSSKDYGRLIDDAQVNELLKLVKSNHGGQLENKLKYDVDKKFFEPLIITNPSAQSQLSTGEVKGPVIVLHKFGELDELHNKFANQEVRNFYYFTKSLKRKLTFFEKFKKSNVIVNNGGIQYLDPYYPYGSTGAFAYSNLGGKNGFKTFSMLRTIVDGGNLWYWKSILPPFTQEKYGGLKKYKMFNRITNRLVRNTGLGLGLAFGYFYFIR